MAGVAEVPTERGPIVVGYDGSTKSAHALRQAAGLLGRARAVVVVVWEPAGAFEAMEPGIEGTPMSIGGSIEMERAMGDRAQSLAEEGARVAAEAGFDAEGLAVPDEERSVPDTLMRIAAERQAAAIVVGTHGHKPVRDLFLGSTARKLIGHAECPVIVVREPDAD